MPPTTISVGSTPVNTLTPPRPAAVAPTATSVIIAAPAHWLKKGGTLTRSSTSQQPVEQAARYQSDQQELPRGAEQQHHANANASVAEHRNPPRIAVSAGADRVQDGGGLTQRQAAADLDRQALQRADVAVVDDVGLDDSNARNGRNAGCRVVRSRDRGVRHVNVHPPQSVRAGDPKCDESDVVGRHAGRQEASGYLNCQVERLRRPARGRRSGGGPLSTACEDMAKRYGVQNPSMTVPANPYRHHTHRLDLEDASLREWSATVLLADPDQGIVLDRSAFYPGGGGQPPDHGVLLWGNVRTRIVGTRKGDDLYLLPAETDPLPPPGTSVHGGLDDERRTSLMRTHSALHVLSAVVLREFGAPVTGGNMEPLLARMDFDLSDVPADFKQRVEDACNEAVQLNRQIEVRVLPREQAMAIPNIIRTASDLLPPDIEMVRIVDINGIDIQADGGTHVASTGMIGRIAVTKMESKGRGFRRVRIRIEDAE